MKTPAIIATGITTAFEFVLDCCFFRSAFSSTLKNDEDYN
jgi:hypothetical protein